MLTPDLLDEFQQRAIDQFYEHDECFAVMPMGSGKTVCALTAAMELMRDDVVDRWLVLGTKAICTDVWIDEAASWSHLNHLKVDTVVGKKPKDRFDFGDADLYCVNYDLIDRLTEDMFKGERWGVIIDEPTKLKAHNGNRSQHWGGGPRRKEDHGLRTAFQIKWSLTGTPKPNRYIELFGQVRAVNGRKLWGRAYTRWRDTHFYQPAYTREYHLLPGAREKILHDINTIGFKIDESELPPSKGARFVDIKVRSSDQAKYIAAALMKQGLATSQGIEVVADSAAIAMNKRRQLEQGFVYYPKPEDPEQVLTLDVDHHKIDALIDLVEQLQGEPLLVFYNFQEDLRRLRHKFPGLRWLGSGVSDAESREARQLWNDGKLEMLALHPASAGHGVQLQHGGRYACWYSLPFSNELYQQANKRIDRRGQKHQVIIYRLIGEIDDRRIVDEVLGGREMSQRSFIDSLKAA